jgi:hypothetical protein
MPYLKKFRYAVSTCLFGVGLAWLCLAQRPLTLAQTADDLGLQFNIAAVVHGFEKAPGLPDGDTFLLPQPMKLIIPRPPANTELFTVSPESFGSPATAMGALAEVPANGVTATQPGETLRALTCAESIWDGNLILAGTAGAEGDVVRLFVQTGDGAVVRNLLRFTREAEGFRLSDLHGGLKLFVDNRFALGPSTPKETLIPFVDEAGPRGQRTGLLTFSFPMDFDSPLHGCFQLGIEINRGQGAGTTSVVVTDIVVNRNRVAGDENNLGKGLLGGLTGGYPTGLPCAVECPPLTQSTPTPTPAVAACKTLCFRSAQFFYFMYCDRPETIPYGNLVVGGANFNHPVATRSLPPAVALRNQRPQAPLHQLNREFVAAQLNLLLAGGPASPHVQEALESALLCYGLELQPIPLGNGFVLASTTSLADLLAQTRTAIEDNRTADMPALAQVYAQLNGNNAVGGCSY